MNTDLVLRKYIEDTLSGRISGEQFVHWFEEYFYNMDESEVKESLYQALEALYEETGYYESTVDLDAEDIYFGDDQLKEKLRTIAALF